MSQPARTTSPRTSRRTPTARTAARQAHVPRTSPTRRTGPVATGPQLRLVPPARTTPARVPSRSRRTARRRAPFVVLLVGLLVATVLGLLLLNTAIAVDSLDATQQRQANAEQAEEVARLEQQVVAADSAAALARAASEVGLVPPGDAAHLVLQPDGSSVLLGTATPAPDPDDPTAGN
jgi:cell division protein FtsB